MPKIPTFDSITKMPLASDCVKINANKTLSFPKWKEMVVANIFENQISSTLTIQENIVQNTVNTDLNFYKYKIVNNRERLLLYVRFTCVYDKHDFNLYIRLNELIEENQAEFCNMIRDCAYSELKFKISHGVENIKIFPQVIFKDLNWERSFKNTKKKNPFISLEKSPKYRYNEKDGIFSYC